MRYKVRFNRDDYVFFILFAVTVVILLVLFDFPPLPHNDFAQFQLPALRYLCLEAPNNYKILPAFPLAIAAVSRFVPDDPTLVIATEIVVLISALVFLFFFGRMARKFSPRLWPFTVLCVATSPWFLEFSLQTLMGTFILAGLTVSFWSVASGWGRASYLLAGLTSLTRYDTVLLAPAIGVSRFFRDGRRWRHLVLAGLALAPLAAWVLVGMAHSGKLNPYVEEILDPLRPSQIPGLFRLLVRMLLGFFPEAYAPLSYLEIGLFLAVTPLVVLGARKLWRDHRETALVTGVTLAGYALVHCVYGTASYRYPAPLLPFLILLFFMGLESLLGTGETVNRTAWASTVAATLAAAAALALGVAWASPHVLALWVFSSGFAVTAARIVSAGGKPGLRTALAAGGCLFLVVLPNLLQWDASYVWQSGRFSEYLALRRWVRTHCKPGDKVLVMAPWYLKGRFDEDVRLRYFDTQFLEADDVPGLVAECKGRGIRYVAWMTEHADFGRRNHYHRHSRAYLLNEAGLGDPRSKPDFTLVARLRSAPGNCALVYRFIPPEDPYRGKDRIDFNAGPVPPYLLGEGWGPCPEGVPGDIGYWALGTQSVFKLYLPAAPSGGALRFTAVPVPELAGKQSVTIFVNDQPVGSAVLAPHDRDYSFAVPAGPLQPGLNVFRLKFSACHVPSKGGTGTDQRPLAVYFKREIRFEPVR